MKPRTKDTITRLAWSFIAWVGCSFVLSLIAFGALDTWQRTAQPALAQVARGTS